MVALARIKNRSAQTLHIAEDLERFLWLPILEKRKTKQQRTVMPIWNIRDCGERNPGERYHLSRWKEILLYKSPIGRTSPLSKRKAPESRGYHNDPKCETSYTLDHRPQASEGHPVKNGLAAPNEGWSATTVKAAPIGRTSLWSLKKRRHGQDALVITGLTPTDNTLIKKECSRVIVLLGGQKHSATSPASPTYSRLWGYPRYRRPHPLTV